ncbi:unnamed protein product [Clonostachys rhizophaga]|uniref:Xaa-Pro dipeptidyl-peptidase C-terminal domain-containing protein n=1 Tax=Clonostachys rhizophaga TaxID=160324 RepID=A0A9N9YIS7_9HYPO|nr:unnamed protein product [Clonostachys rhizophaga]
MANQNQPSHPTRTDDVEGYTRIKNIYIRLRDGVELCADVFLPFSASKQGAKVPAILSLGPYGKDIHVLDFGLPKTTMYIDMYKQIEPVGPDGCFELVDPILWTKEYGYALVRVDARGIGGSQGRLDPFGMERSLLIQADAEGQDLYDVIEWAGTRSWSSGKVALSGISYYGMSGYWAAMQRPPHLSAVISYEASVDLYQAARKGGILGANFQIHWYNNIVLPYQCGSKTLSATELAANRVDYPALVAQDEYPDGESWRLLKQLRKLSDIEVPLYISGNWTDSEVHLPGNILAYRDISSEQKWLEMHTGNHLACYYKSEHVALQKSFLDYFLKGDEESGILSIPRVRLITHRGNQTLYRENEITFPPLDAQNVILHLTPSQELSFAEPPGNNKKKFEYAGLTGTLTFELETLLTEPFEILGTPYVELEVATEAEDQDIFLTLRAFDSDGKVFILEGNHSEPNEHFAKGYWRLSHRDEVAAGFGQENGGIPSQPVVSKAPVEKGRVYNVKIPFLPTAFVLDQGQKLSLEIGAQDTLSTIPPMRHDGGDREQRRFGGKNIIYSHGKLVLPRVQRPLP